MGGDAAISSVRSLGFRTDLALLALGGSVLEARADHLVVRTPANPTFWWGNFLLLRAAPTPVEVGGWLARFHTEFPDAEHVAIGVDDPEGDEATLTPFTDRGLHAEAGAVMTATALRPPRRRHDGAECRPLVSESDWQQSVELRLRCDEGGFDSPDHADFVEARAATNRGLVETGRARWFGAFLAGRLVAQLGLVDAGGGLARYQTVETDPAHRRLGLAGMLLGLAARWGKDVLRARTLVIVADVDYVAIDLYRGVGFETTERQLNVQHQPF